MIHFQDLNQGTDAIDKDPIYEIVPTYLGCGPLCWRTGSIPLTVAGLGAPRPVGSNFLGSSNIFKKDSSSIRKQEKALARLAG